jgi:hypothetical protein
VKLGDQELYIYKDSEIIARVEWLLKHSLSHSKHWLG